MQDTKANEAKTYYYGVVYFKNGEASVSAPFDSLEKCIQAMKDGIAKHPDAVVGTTYMTRGKLMSTKKLLGFPKSRDLMRDKKFRATL